MDRCQRHDPAIDTKKRSNNRRAKELRAELLTGRRVGRSAEPFDDRVGDTLGLVFLDVVFGVG